MIDTQTLIVFIVSVCLMIMLDLYLHRKDAEVSFKSAVCWSLFYIACAFAFAGYIYLTRGAGDASLFLTGYSLEKVLAFDNLFVFSLIFTYFKIPDRKKHAALHWGIAGAIVFRLVFVIIGAKSIEYIGGTVELVFAFIILFTVYLMAKSDGDDDVDYDKVWYVRLIRKAYPGASVFFIAVCVIEVSDIIFSFDSVPAIIAVTKDPMLIYSSMIFAILGLRSMFFIIESLNKYFVNMDKAVMCVLVFISAKLILSSLISYHIDPNISLIVIIIMLTVGAVSSLFTNKVSEV